MATRDVGWLPGTELLYSVPQALGFIAYESDFACDGECFFDKGITEPDTTSAHCYYKRFHFRDQLGLLRS